VVANYFTVSVSGTSYLPVYTISILSVGLCVEYPHYFSLVYLLSCVLRIPNGFDQRTFLKCPIIFINFIAHFDPLTSEVFIILNPK